jgi:hypothetical protein
MMHVLNWLERGVRSLSCRVQFCAGLLLLVGFGLGCCTTTPTTGPIPRCPEPSDELIHEILERRVPPGAEEYIARVENLCSALRVLEDGG